MEPDLREVHLGEWEGGLFRIRVVEGHPLARQMFLEERWDVIPGAEPADDFARRVRDVLTRLAARHPDQTVAVFTHGGVIGRALAEATGSRPFAFGGADNGSISHLVLMPERWMLAGLQRHRPPLSRPSLPPPNPLPERTLDRDQGALSPRPASNRRPDAYKAPALAN